MRFFQLAGPDQQIRGDFPYGPEWQIKGNFTNRPGRVSKREMSFPMVGSGCKKKEDESHCATVQADKTKTKLSNWLIKD